MDEHILSSHGGDRDISDKIRNEQQLQIDGDQQLEQESTPFLNNDPPSLPSQTQQQQQLKYLQHISLQFEKPTTYLSIPMKKIKNALLGETHRVNIGKPLVLLYFIVFEIHGE